MGRTLQNLVGWRKLQSIYEKVFLCFDGRERWGGRGGGGGQQKIHEMGGTPIMPLPTKANPGLCCNRIKKKHELNYALEILQ